MRYEYIEPLVASTKKVLMGIMKGKVTNGDPLLVGGNDLKEDVSILISVKGDSEGHIIVGFDRETAARLGTIMNGEVFDPSSDWEDALSELSNMIAGNATSALNDLGYDFSIFPPSLVPLAEIREKTEGVEVFRVPLGTPCGEISINVAFKTN